MPEYQIAGVAVEGSAYHFDIPYRYLVPSGLEGRALPGARAVVPFGRGNGRRRAVIVSLTGGGPEPEETLKPLLEVPDSKPMIGVEMIALAQWMKDQTFCTMYEALRLMFPPGLDLQILRSYSLSPDLSPEALESLSDGERELTAVVSAAKSPVESGKLLESAGLAPDSPLPGRLVRKGILICDEGIRDKNAGASVRMVRLALSEQDIREMIETPKALTKKQKSVVQTVLEAGSATVREICYFAGVTAAVVVKLAQKGILELFDQKVYRSPVKSSVPAEDGKVELSAAQQKSFESLCELYRRPGGCASLLFGVTGSGKTQVFMKLIDTVRADGKGVIVLVPEISLTPQAVSLFYARFGDRVAVLHSGLSIGERADEWQRVSDGQAEIVVGTRSAIFAPVKNLGLIIIDEEQEHTYKSESSPRYHARDVARFRCAKSGAMLLLASATPSVETFFAAQAGRYHLTRLDDRYGGASLPEVIAVDMKRELQDGNDSPISSLLLEELRKQMASGRQSILLLNRRGFNTFVSCLECGHVMTCPNCSIALTYHSANGRLMCHYCGYSAELSDKCPECSGRHIRYAGAGTQRAEAALFQAIPGIRVLRMDTDTTSSRNSHETILRKFEQEKYDVLIGTQMVAKGLDFPNVTLVGVLSADQTLYMDDFRASERTFSLLTQVVGRSGRGENPGRAVIQTQTPENEIIKLASAQDYDRFFASEIKIRKLMLYPPFCDICEVGFSGLNENRVASAAQAFFDRLRQAVGLNPGVPVRVIGPSPTGILKVGGRFRYKIIIKCKNDKKFRTMLSGLLKQAGPDKRFRGVAVFADLNPQSML